MTKVTWLTLYVGLIRCVCLNTIRCWNVFENWLASSVLISSLSRLVTAHDTWSWLSKFNACRNLTSCTTSNHLHCIPLRRWVAHSQTWPPRSHVLSLGDLVQTCLSFFFPPSVPGDDLSCHQTWTSAISSLSAESARSRSAWSSFWPFPAWLTVFLHWSVLLAFVCLYLHCVRDEMLDASLLIVTPRRNLIFLDEAFHCHPLMGLEMRPFIFAQIRLPAKSWSTFFHIFRRLIKLSLLANCSVPIQLVHADVDLSYSRKIGSASNAVWLTTDADCLVAVLGDGSGKTIWTLMWAVFACNAHWSFSWWNPRFWVQRWWCNAAFQCKKSLGCLSMLLSFFGGPFRFLKEMWRWTHPSTQISCFN